MTPDDRPGSYWVLRYLIGVYGRRIAVRELCAMTDIDRDTAEQMADQVLDEWDQVG